ncbi:MAG: PH domain-containing protein [Actinobacteria bacterium]|nr:PH domain-containing protein [Actinomycetota bacterium]MCG2798337.1 PH domain-containing protein [Cellulomonas sp.]
MTEVPHDKRDQLQKVTSGLLDGEELYAVYDCTGAGTGFVGLTDRRLVLQDNSFVGAKVAVTSVPYSQIKSVSMVSNKSWTGGFFSTATVAINLGGTIHEAEFRGVAKAQHVHNLIVWKITAP